MNVDECIHGLGPVASCTVCNGRDRREAQRHDDVDYAFEAGFTGRLDCGDWVNAGEQIYRLHDGRLVCAECTT